MASGKKTVLFVMPRLPFPASSGRKTSLYHYCRILSDELGCRLIVAAFLESGDDPCQKPDFIDRLVILPKPSVKEKLFNIFGKSLVRKQFPLQVSLYLSEEAKKLVDKLILEEKPDIVIGDMVRSTEYIRHANAYTVADLDDRISLRYKRQLETDIDGINPYGAFLGTVPGILRKLMLLRPVKLAVVRNEISLLNKYELEIGKACNATVFVAEKEVREFNSELGEEKATAVPIGVDTDYFYYRECGNDENTIGFLGAMSVAHNENAVRHFIEDIFPLVLTKIPDAKFMVIGGGASEKLRNLASDHVIFTGRVDDVREYVERCKVFVCPMTFGSGIKTKNLEAMAMGLPVVTTSIGAENIDAVDGDDWLIADEPETFADQVVSLLLKSERRNEIGKNASTFVNEKFSWDVAEKQFETILSSC